MHHYALIADIMLKSSFSAISRLVCVTDFIATNSHEAIGYASQTLKPWCVKNGKPGKRITGSVEKFLSVSLLFGYVAQNFYPIAVLFHESSSRRW
jgi:hypothetical protein